MIEDALNTKTADMLCSEEEIEVIRLAQAQAEMLARRKQLCPDGH